MILLLIGFAILVVVMAFCVAAIGDCTNIAISIIVFIFAIIGLACIASYIHTTPTALDVYKGKTELRITYDGKIPVDSVVIYKKGDNQ